MHNNTLVVWPGTEAKMLCGHIGQSGPESGKMRLVIVRVSAGGELYFLFVNIKV